MPPGRGFPPGRGGPGPYNGHGFYPPGHGGPPPMDDKDTRLRRVCFPYEHLIIHAISVSRLCRRRRTLGRDRSRWRKKLLLPFHHT